MTNSKNFYYQQGDVLVVPVEKFPSDDLTTIEPSFRGNILAEGESTGHAHVMSPQTTRLLSDRYDHVFLEVFEATVLKHEEHGAITIDPGLYEVGRIREYDPFEEEIRNVRD